jgi:hypothetical protein
MKNLLPTNYLFDKKVIFDNSLCLTLSKDSEI